MYLLYIVCVRCNAQRVVIVKFLEYFRFDVMFYELCDTRISLIFEAFSKSFSSIFLFSL
jgi:hypothetical protein